MKTSIILSCFFALLWLASVVGLCYWPQQEDFNIIFALGCVGFASYFYLYKYGFNLGVKWIIGISILARLLIVPSFPNFSDDIYRFIWDGRSWHMGLNPFAALPTDVVHAETLTADLLSLLNSPSYFTIYPPVAQFIFWISTFVQSTNFISEAFVMKSIHFIFELGTLRLVWLLLQRYKLPIKNWILYALNPLVIVEVIGNVHHEGIMLFFVLACIYTLEIRKIALAGVFMGLAIASKVLPLLFCPLLFFRLRGRDRWVFTITVIASVLVLFGPMLYPFEIVGNLVNSADLYVRSFEFNASVYYLFNAVGKMIYGYNIIGTLGPQLKILTLLSIVAIAIRYRNTSQETLPFYMLISYGTFVLLSSTIHPWYVIMLVGLAPFTNLKFPFFWSGLIMLTYINYSYPTYSENLWVVALEYFAVLGVFVYEYKIERDSKIQPVF